MASLQTLKHRVRQYSLANRRRLSGPGLRTFVRIADPWGLTAKQRRSVLGSPSPTTYRRWIKAAREHQDLQLSVDVLTRVSAVLGVHAALVTLHEQEVEQLEWLSSEHHALVFGGQPPLHLIVDGSLDALLTVKRFLAAACEGIYMPPNEVDLLGSPDLDEEIVFAGD